jgi:hypothetical protein
MLPSDRYCTASEDRSMRADAPHRRQRTPPTVRAALLAVFRNPVDCLIRKWNWKSAITSSLFRAPIFFFVNLPAGRSAAIGAFVTELVLRSLTSGFYGSVTQSLREAEPAWFAGLTAAVLMPALNHSVELLVHWLRGTPKLAHSIFASVCFTAVSTLFNLYIMRRGAYVVGEDRRSFAEDLRRTPALVIGFLAAGPIAIVGLFRRRGTAVTPPRTQPGWESEGG